MKQTAFPGLLVLVLLWCWCCPSQGQWDQLGPGTGQQWDHWDGVLQTNTINLHCRWAPLASVCWGCSWRPNLHDQLWWLLLWKFGLYNSEALCLRNFITCCFMELLPGHSQLSPVLVAVHDAIKRAAGWGNPSLSKKQESSWCSSGLTESNHPQL